MVACSLSDHGVFHRSMEETRSHSPWPGVVLVRPESCAFWVWADTVFIAGVNQTSEPIPNTYFMNFLLLISFPLFFIALPFHCTMFDE